MLAIRLALIFINLLILANVFGRADLFFNQLILGIALIIQFLEILHFVSKTNRDLAKFILAIKEADFTASFTGGPRDKSFQRLYQSFKDILDTIRLTKLEKEAQSQFLQIIIDHINIGIISMDDKGQIELMNKKSLELLKVPRVKSWQHLKSQSKQFFEQVSALRDEDNQLIEIAVNQRRKQLTVNITVVKLLYKSFRVITFKDIKSELDRKEIEAWHKLIRILTHEIMNSVTPMVSLTETMKMLLEQPDGKQKPVTDLDKDTIEDLRFSFQTISNRGEGLLHFVEDYRKLTKIPEPVREELNASKIVNGVLRLMKAEMEENAITVRAELDDALTILADPKLIEQVLINILTNAIHALEETDNGLLDIVLEKNEDRSVFIRIKDNGDGIDHDKLDKIFVPFFSTKEKGSGIGLSLCQQIMNLHGGIIEAHSDKGQGASFTIIFLT